MEDTLILFANRAWGAPISVPGLELPVGCEITEDKARFKEAVAVVFHLPETPNLTKLRKPPGQIWVAWSAECEAHYPHMQDPAFMARFDLSMTYHLDADVPTTYIPHDRPNFGSALRSMPGPKPKEKLATLFLSTTFDQSGRTQLVTELMEHLDVHSYGHLLRNRVLKEDTGAQTKLDVLARYKFNICPENAVEKDYVTEKFFDPLLAGSVPVYLGAPNIEDFAPGDRCFINIKDYPTPRALAEALLALGEDDTAYGKYHEWRSRPFRDGFTRLVEEQREPALVRLCREVLELGKAGDGKRRRIRIKK